MSTPPAPMPDWRRSALAVVLTLFASASAAGAPECADRVARLESVDGRVELRRDGQAAWGPARGGEQLCTGDAIRTRASGRAALRLRDRTLVRVDNESSLTFPAPDDEGGLLVDLLRGIINVISRDPRSLRFDTPYANAGLEGTEFTIQADADATRVTVVEGEVLVANPQARVLVSAGAAATADAGPNVATARVDDAFAALRWAGFVPRVIAGPLPDADAAVPPGAARADFLVRRAAARSAAGRLADARADVAAALALEPEHAPAHALEAQLELAAGDEAAALEAARAATAADGGSVAALLALSYAEQARAGHGAARTAARDAAAADPGSALAAARVAELELAAGNARAALAAAETARTADSELAHAHVVEGFAELRLGAAARALDAFERAARLEPSAPLPHVGRGLALTRSDAPERGREAFELALALDPANAAMRNHVARAYAAEHRDALAATQTALARRLDPGDPTAYLYDALGRQQRNELVPALESLDAHARRSGDRGLFRSSFRLSEDLALRSAGFGQLYRDLGFEQLAMLRGWQASVHDARDYAPRRLLADIYSARPRHEIARVNALWQAQLLQPLNVRPVPPQLAESNLFILDEAGPSELAFNEFGPLMRRDGPMLQGSAVTGSHGTRGADVEIAGLDGPLSYSLGAFGFESDGFRPNNDIDQHVANAMLQYRAGPATSVFGELRRMSTTKGDLKLRFDPEAYAPGLRQTDEVDSLRLGMRRDVGDRGTLLAAAIRDDIDTSVSTGSTFSTQVYGRSDTLDVAYLRTRDAWQIQSGIRRFDASWHEPTGLVPATQHMRSAYAYADVQATRDLTLTLGFSADSLSGDEDIDELSPKLGAIWHATPATTVRAAAFSTLQGSVVSKEIIQPRLEPTHVAGFNQFFFGTEGEHADRIGIGVDRSIGPAVDAGLELSARTTSTSVTVSLPGAPETVETAAADERGLRAYVYWTPSSRVGVSAAYDYEDIDFGGTRAFVDGYARLETRRLPVSISLSHAPRLQTRVTASLVEQSGLFGDVPFTPGEVAEPGSDSFAVVDVGVSYRLPQRRGKIALEARNVFDERFRFQDVDPENTRFFPERTLSLRLTLSY